MPQLTINYVLLRLAVYGDALERQMDGIEYIIRHLLVRVEFNYSANQTRGRE
jgi:hypothetical protein